MDGRDDRRPEGVLAMKRPVRVDMSSASASASLKQRVIEELKAFCITALYLSLFLGAFTFYRRMLLAEVGVAYLHYGIALLEALIIAKVVLLGRALGLDKEVD